MHMVTPLVSSALQWISSLIQKRPKSTSSSWVVRWQPSLTPSRRQLRLSQSLMREKMQSFVSPHKGNQVATSGGALSSTQQENTLAFFSDLTSTSYAVFDSGYKYVYDRFSDKYRYIPCNGDVAGLCVQTSSIQEDWYSPAGLNRGGILNAVKLAYNPNKGDRDEALSTTRINPHFGTRVRHHYSVIKLHSQHLLHSIVSTFVASSSTLRREHADLLKAYSSSKMTQLQKLGFNQALNNYLRGSGT